MAEIKSFPNNQDEYSGAEDVMRWLHGRTSGVFAAAGNAAVAALATPGMAVTVSDGTGWMANANNDGVVWWNDAESVSGAKLQLSIDAADGVLNRIDRVIVEWKTTNYVDRPEIKVLKGTASSTAAAPALTNNGTLRQISLAQISVAAGTTAITASMITDERQNTAVCGLVTESLSIDTSVINSQFSELLMQLKTAIEQAESGVLPDGAVTTTKYADKSITAAKIADKTINAAQIADATIIPALTTMLADNAGAHNSLYRGKNLGSGVTAAQYAAIQAGTFDDMYIGDYWTIGGVTYRIAAFDYYLLAGDTDTTTHHVTLVPDAPMYSHVMNGSNVTTGGYVGSKMYTTGLADAKTTINNAFGSAHILTHRQYLCNAVSNGKPSGGSWYDSTVELMTEQNVYGGKVFGAGNDGSAVPHLYTVDKSQYPLFAFRPDMISNRNWFWLRDVVSAAGFARAYGDGRAFCNGASSSSGVRPAFSIKS